ncbi:hypothetical protein ES705_09378 [subsurface metagenome]
MNLRNIKLIVWHKREKARYKVLTIDWNTANIELIKLEGEDPKAMEGMKYESIDSVVLIEVRFNDY